jgi:hypothetical protein
MLVVITNVFNSVLSVSVSSTGGVVVVLEVETAGDEDDVSEYDFVV